MSFVSEIFAGDRCTDDGIRFATRVEALVYGQLGPAASGGPCNGRVSWFIGRGRRRGAPNADSISRQCTRNDTGLHRSRKPNGLNDYK
jgi:hypothetical protein